MKTTSYRFAACLRHLRWQAALIWSRLDFLAMTAIAGISLFAALWVLVLVPLRHDIQQLAYAQTRLARQPIQKAALRVDFQQDGKRAFVAFLPAVATREQQLLELHKLFTQYGLVVGRIEYQYQKLATLPVEQMALRLSMQGAYAAQRKMLHDMLKAFPNLAVERLALESMADKADTLSQRLELHLYYQAAAADGNL